MRLLGVVLAGGESRRFGSPKALARLHGRPLWHVAAGVLRGRVADVVAIANDADIAGQIELETRPDDRPGLGPLAGVETAVKWADERGLDGALVIACDMPWIEPEGVDGLVQAWEADRIVAPLSNGPLGFEPLCAIYPTSVAGPAGTALVAGQLEVGAFVRSLDPLLISAFSEGGEPLRSVNARGDLPPPTVAVIGNKKSGKTTLAVSLIGELSQRGRNVMSTKHGHHFRLEPEGTDSWRHRNEGGAGRVLLVGPDEFALMGGWRGGVEPELDRLLTSYLSDAEVVIAEGFRNSPVPKIEIYRSEAQPEPILDPAGAAGAGAIAAVTDQPELPWSVPVFDPDDEALAKKLTDLIEDRLL